MKGRELNVRKRSVAPAALKKLIGQKRPEFSGSQAHNLVGLQGWDGGKPKFGGELP